MTDQNDVVDKGSGDLSGRSRIARNVVTSWASQFLFIITGFILPRLISNRLGADALGIWDLAWSVVSYFGIMQAGVGSSVNRYVAKHFAAGDSLAVNQTISSAVLIQNVAALLVLIFSAAAALMLPRFLSPSLGLLIVDAQFVVFFVGCGLAVQMITNAFVGLVTGLHRWDLHNGLNAGGYFLIAVGMIVSLLNDGGLRSLALINLSGIAVTEALRVVLGYHAYPSLRVRPRFISSSVMKEQFVFGGKVLVPSISRLLSVQTVNVLVVVFIGPTALAILARPMALIRIVTTLIGKYAYVLTPVSSAYYAGKNRTQMAELFLTSSKAAYLISIPMISAIAILGKELLEVWMGPTYAIAYLSMVIALGNSATMCHIPMNSILMGQDAHGFPGMAKFVAAFISVVAVYVTIKYFSDDLVILAAVTALPLFVVDGIVIPLYALRRLELQAATYVSQALLPAMLLNAPFVAALILIKYFMPGSALHVLFFAAAIGSIVIFSTYWRGALSPKLKQRIVSKVFRKNHSN